MARVDEADIQELDEIAAYHEDAIEALVRYFKNWERLYTVRYLGMTRSEIDDVTQRRVRETELRSILQLLASVEAALRVDYRFRRKRRAKDPLSRAFREIRPRSNDRARLDEDILKLWGLHHPELKDIIGKLRGALHLRHWLAHGRYWKPNNWIRYSYEEIEDLARAFFERFPLFS